MLSVVYSNVIMYFIVVYLHIAYVYCIVLSLCVIKCGILYPY